MRSLPANCCTVLTTLGYTEREAAFLRMVAMHSGVFLRRQYVSFTGAGQGKAVHGFIAKFVTRRHGRPICYGDNQTLYHLTNKRLYRILGIENSNNRRARSDQTLKAHLMALDFVIAHADARFLETEGEKAAFFREQFGARPDQFPAKGYPAGSFGASGTRRYFVEKFPIFVVPDDAPATPHARPTVAFSFMDDGQVTAASFCAFLNRYSQLLGLIPRFRLYYVTDTPTKIPAAERAFRRLNAFSGTDAADGQSIELERLRTLARRWNEGKTNFTAEEFAELARLQKGYGHLIPKACEQLSLYDPRLESAHPHSTEREALFIAYPLPDAYRFCGELRPANKRDEVISPLASPLPSPLPSPTPLQQAHAGEELTRDLRTGSGQTNRPEPVSPPAGNDPTGVGFAAEATAKFRPAGDGASRSRHGAPAPSRSAAAAPKAGAAFASNYDGSSIED